MPLKLDIKRTLNARSDRVKCVDLHATEPWMLASLYNGNVHVWNLESQILIKTFEVCEVPVRAAKFVARKNWMVSGSDDMQIRVFNYNTLERVHAFEAHSDYIRCIVVHPTQPFVLSSGDDMTIKLWDWDKKWICAQLFEGHSHYVMQLVINPKDNNTFASASLDKSIKVWSLGSGTANFTMEGHEKGVNCLDYYSGGDKPYLVSGADDRLVKIWDYQTKTCVHTLDGHAQNISAVSFHPELPIIITGSEDGTIRVWHANTYRLETTLNYGLERVWSVACLRRSNSVAIGYDEGSIVIKLGREEPAMSMDSNGKMVFARHADLQQANIKALGGEMGDIQDGDRVPLNPKELGSCEIYPQTIAHNANGKFVVVCGDGEYIVYTAMALRNKAFGQAHEFVWSQADPGMYAIRDGSGLIKIFRNMKEERSFKPDFGVETIFGGWLLAVRSVSGLAFYDWSTATLIRRIEVSPKSVYWNDAGQLVAVVTDESFYILRYNVGVVEESVGGTTDEDGIEGAFELTGNGEITDVVKNGVWVGDCFLYTNNANRLQYSVGGEMVTVAHLERHMYLLGYLPKENRVFLADRSLQIISYTLLLSVLEYQTLVMRRDFEAAETVLPVIPRDQLARVAQFLEKQGFREQALAVTTDSEHKFELALSLGRLQLAFDVVDSDLDNSTEAKWRQIAEAATKACEWGLAQEALSRAHDYASLLLLASSTGNRPMLDALAAQSAKDGQHNMAFLSRFLLNDLDGCLQLLLDAGRYSEAGFFGRAYLPSRIPEVVELWKAHLATKANKKVADALANPAEYPNMFTDYEEMKKIEIHLKRVALDKHKLPATAYLEQEHMWDRDPVHELHEAIPQSVVASSKPAIDNLHNHQLPGNAATTVTNAAAVSDQIPDQSAENDIEDEIDEELLREDEWVDDDEDEENSDDGSSHSD